MNKFLLIVFFMLVSMSIVHNFGGTSAADILRQIQKDCGQEMKRTAFVVCFRTHLRAQAQQYDTKELMNGLATVLSEDGPFGVGHYYLCHDVAHVIGQRAGENVADTTGINGCTHICSSGCFHGFVESLVAGGEDIAQHIPSLCSQEGAKFQRACFHGIGHGVGSIVGSLEEAISLCSLLGSDFGKIRCFSGALMEKYGEGSLLASDLTYPEDTLSWCAGFEGIFKTQCMVLAGEKQLLASGDPDAAAAICRTISPDRQSECFFVLGEAMAFFYKQDSTSLIAGCRKTREFIEPCLSGVFWGIAESDPQVRLGDEICDRIKEDEPQFPCQALLAEQVAYEQSTD